MRDRKKGGKECGRVTKERVEKETWKNIGEKEIKTEEMRD